MTANPTPERPPTPCRAIPAAARRGWRVDALCASIANTDVSFRGTQVPVCRMHQATYVRWGDDAERNAVELWGWDTPHAPA
jgi:hypothetical protein